MTLRNTWIIGALLAAAIVCAWAFTAKAHAAECTTDTPVTYDGVGQAATDIYNGGAYDGTGHFAGTATCPDAKDNTSDLMAISAALSTPVWLESGERFSVSGGLGFTEDSTAVGATGLMRFDKTFSGFAGGAVSTDDTDMWAGKAGIRAGW
jgi:hypothetical protein